MPDFRFHLRQTYLAYLYRRIRDWYFERYRLPHITRASLHGVHLDIEGLNPGMKKIILSGKYENPEITLCSRLLKSEDRILELGGAIGFVGLYCLKSIGVARIVSVEPNPNTAERLRRNYGLNQLPPSVIEAAVGSTNCTIPFHISPDFWGDSAFASGKETGGTSITVPAHTLPTLFEMAGEAFTAMLIDVEGAELYIDWTTIPPSVSTVIMEMHPSIIGYMKAYEVLHQALNNGFYVSDRVKEVVALVRR